MHGLLQELYYNSILSTPFNILFILFFLFSSSKLYIAYCLFCEVIVSLAKFVSLYVQVHLCSGVFLSTLPLLSQSCTNMLCFLLVLIVIHNNYRPWGDK